MKKSLTIGMLLAMTVTLVSGCDDWSFCGSNDSSQAEVSLYVSDASSGQPVVKPVFTDEGAVVSAACHEPDAANPDACDYQLLLLDQSLHTIRVAAEGYVSTTVTVDTTESIDVHLSVELRPVRPIRAADVAQTS